MNRYISAGRLIITFTVTALSIVGCVTPYQPMSFSGGYKDMALNKNTYVVTFRGNGFTSPNVVQSYVLRRSAQLALNNGYKFFIILNAGTNTRNQVMRTPTTVQTQSFGSFQGNTYGAGYNNYNVSGYGNSSSYTTINPGSEYDIKKYQTSATVKMLHSNKGYPQALNAAIVLSNFSK